MESPRFHINPKTWDVSRCSAQRQCPLGGVEHYPTPEETRQAVERAFSHLTIPAPVKGRRQASERLLVATP